MTAIAGIPKTEIIWVTYTSEKGEVYHITAKTNNRAYYYLYKMVDGKAQKLGRARTPTELEEKFLK
jgi:hypothetical protein